MPSTLPKQQETPKEAPGIDPKKDIEENKVVAAVSYIWVLSVVVYFARRNSPFARFHAKQGMVLFGISAALFILLKALFLYDLLPLTQLLVIVLSVVGFLHAAMGQKFELPVIYQLSTGNFRVSEMIDSVKRALSDLSVVLKAPDKKPSDVKPAAKDEEPKPDESQDPKDDSQKTS